MAEPILTVEQAELLRPRLHELTPLPNTLGRLRHHHHARKRFERSLAGLREALEGGCWGCPDAESHARRYSEDLRDLAKLYGARVPAPAPPPPPIPDCDGRCNDGRDVCTLWHGER